MNHEELTKKIDAYLDDNWDVMVEDIATLVRIPSFLESDKAADGAPFGPGPKQALDAALGIAEAHGLPDARRRRLHRVRRLSRRLGHADRASSAIPTWCRPARAWTFEPYEVTRKDGYLMGRGTLDDKGPSMVALHAMKFWKDQGAQFPYTLRFLFGTNEESGMGDVAYYHLHYDDPAFLFTPDAEFPVCYGEKGGFDGLLMSKPLPESERVIVSFTGGAATNAVPGLADAVVKAKAGDLPDTDRILVTEDGPGRARLSATGKSAHASLPDDGVNAIGLIVDYLLEHDLCSPDERAFLELGPETAQPHRRQRPGHSGAGRILRAAHRGRRHHGDQGRPFRAVARQPLPLRPSRADEITERVRQLAERIGGAFENTLLMEPFLVKPDSPVIQALLDAYNEATGEDAKPFTMGGGTYAREFKAGASFGPEKPWVKDPDWVGGMHGPDEGVSEELLKQSFKIYALTSRSSWSWI